MSLKIGLPKLNGKKTEWIEMSYSANICVLSQKHNFKKVLTFFIHFWQIFPFPQNFLVAGFLSSVAENAVRWQHC
jgi:hypothetical protein